MVPAAFVEVGRLPLTANGKLDRSALPPPEEVQTREESSYIAPRTAGETVLAELWAAILKVERVGVHDNFFDLGGHSLLATQLLSHIRRAFQVEMPLRAVFEHPTVASQAEVIELLLRSAAGDSGPADSPDAGGQRETGEL